jgi:hypothetical protein
MLIALALKNNATGTQISIIFWWCKYKSLYHHILDVVFQMTHLHRPVYVTVDKYISIALILSTNTSSFHY